MKQFFSILVVATVWYAFSAEARADVGGGAFIPIQDGSGHACIDVTKSTVSISLVTAQLKRTNKFWKKSTSMGVKVDVKILNQLGQPFNFPRGRRVSVSSYKGDIGYLPLIFPVTSKYSLINPANNKPYVNIGIDVYTINIETKSGQAKGLSSFIEFSKNLPLPVNPYVQGVQLFGEFAKTVIEDNIQSEEEKSPAATFAFDLADSAAQVAKCKSQSKSSWLHPILREGTVAVMWDFEGRPEDGFVRISEVDKYCYYPTRSRRITFGPKVNGNCPTTVPTKFLNNPLIAFSINEWARNPASIKSFNVSPFEFSMTQPMLLQSAATAVVNSSHSMDKAFRQIDSKNVKFYFDAINSGNLKKSFESKIAKKDNSTTSAAVLEAETAIALHRCALFGIAANDCL